MSIAEHPLAERFVAHDRTYLLSHSIGLPLRGSSDVAAGYFDTWANRTAEAWPEWLDGIDRFRRALAALLRAETRSICPQSNVSSGLTKLLDSLGHRFRQPTVLISEDAFPSLGFVCERSDYAVRFLPHDVDIARPGSLERTPRGRRRRGDHPRALQHRPVSSRRRDRGRRT